VAGTAFHVDSGDLVWIPPDTPHGMSGTSEKMHCLYVHFDLVYDPKRSHWDACIPEGTLDLSPFANYMHPPIADPLIRSLCGLVPLEKGDGIPTLLTRICAEHRRSSNRALLRLSGMMLELLDIIFRRNAGEPNGPIVREIDMKMEQAAAWIRENCRRPLDVKALSRRFGLSASHFRKTFHRIQGRSPRELYCDAKMAAACELLAYTDRPITEIAESLGYGSVHSFSRAFRDAVSSPPALYRRGGMPCRSAVR
jgi:AraC-like DNA-binding protein